MIKIKLAHEYEQTSVMIKPRTASEVFILIVFVVALGITSAFILNYTYDTRMEPVSSNLEGYFGSMLYTDKELYRTSETVLSGVNLANTSEEDIILERVQYQLSVYALSNVASSVFSKTDTVELESITVSPHNYYSFTLDETWDQRDSQGRQVPDGKYLIEVQIPSYNLTLSKIIYIK